jgi:hypothetical protein
MRKKTDFDPSEHYGNVETHRGKANKSYRRKDLEEDGCKKSVFGDREIYILEGGNSDMDLVFEHTGYGWWRMSEACRNLVLFSEYNFTPHEFLENILEDLTPGKIVTKKQRASLDTLLVSLNNQPK